MTDTRPVSRTLYIPTTGKDSRKTMDCSDNPYSCVRVCRCPPALVWMGSLKPCVEAACCASLKRRDVNDQTDSYGGMDIEFHPGRETTPQGACRPLAITHRYNQ
jgi:hypothetical protein